MKNGNQIQKSAVFEARTYKDMGEMLYNQQSFYPVG